MSAVAITVDGVMRKHVGSAPIPTGVKLYNALATQYSVHLLTDERMMSGYLQEWLDLQGLREHVAVHWNDVVLEAMSPADRRLQQVIRVDIAAAVEFIVEPDPHIAAGLLHAGWNVMLPSYATYTLPSWRPDFHEEPQPWDDLQRQIGDQARLKAMEREQEPTDVM